jgi:integrase
VVQQGHETAANRYLVYLRMLFGWARKRKLVEADPTRDVDKPGAESSRTRVLTLEEIRAIWQATTQANEGDLFASIVKVLLLTGQRRNEVAGMRWSEVDLRGALWSLPAERCKNGRPHLVPLSAPVAVILEERRAEQKGIGLKDEEEKPTDLVFTTNGKTPFSGWIRSKARLDGRVGKALEEVNPSGSPAPAVAAWTLHDLRRTLVTRMSEDLRVQPHVVEAVVNHVSGTRAGVAGIYNRALYLDERRSALDAWGRYVLRTAGLPEPENVVELRHARPDSPDSAPASVHA